MARPKGTTPRLHVQFLLPKEIDREIEQAVVDGLAPTKSELVIQAVTLYFAQKKSPLPATSATS